MGGDRWRIEIARWRYDIWTWRCWRHRVRTKGEGRIHHQIRHCHQMRVDVEGQGPLVPRRIVGRHPILKVDYRSHVDRRLGSVDEIVVTPEEDRLIGIIIQNSWIASTHGRYRSLIVAGLGLFGVRTWGVTASPSLRSRYKISTANPEPSMTPSTSAWRPTSSISVLTVSTLVAQYESRGMERNA